MTRLKSFATWFAISVLFSVEMLGSSAQAVLRTWDDGGATSNWSDTVNWTSDTLPAPDDDALIGTLPEAFDDVVLFDLPGDTIKSLTLSNGADFDTNNGRLVAKANISIGAGANSGTTLSELIVRPRNVVGALAAIDANAIDVGANGQLRMVGGEIDIDGTGPVVDGVLSIAAGGILSGFGLIDLSDTDASLGAPTSLFRNTGEVTLGDGSGDLGEPATVTLHITASLAPLFGQVDLGSTGSGTVSVLRNATLKVEPVLFGPEQMTLSSNATLDYSQDWVLEAGSTLEINSGVFSPGTPEELPPAPAVLTGSGAITTSGSIEIDQADEELIIEMRIDGSAGEIMNRGIVRFRGGGGIRGIALTALDGGMMINESTSQLSFQGGNAYETPLTNAGVMGIFEMDGDATAQLESFTQTTAGTLQIDVGGVLAGEFDVLAVDGDAALDGALDIDLAGIFAPAMGDTFEILTAPNGAITGQFDTLNFPALSGLEFEIVYNAQNVVLQVIASSGGFAGDFDNDGDVDGADFLKWQRGETLDPFSLTDLADWQNDYGAPGSLSSVSTAVPEPTTGLCLMIALPLAPCWRIRISQH